MFGLFKREVVTAYSRRAYNYLEEHIFIRLCFKHYFSLFLSSTPTHIHNNLILSVKPRGKMEGAEQLNAHKLYGHHSLYTLTRPSPIGQNGLERLNNKTVILYKCFAPGDTVMSTA